MILGLSTLSECLYASIPQQQMYIAKVLASHPQLRIVAA